MIYEIDGGSISIEHASEPIGTAGFMASTLGVHENRNTPKTLPDFEFAAALDGIESFMLSLYQENVLTFENRLRVERALNHTYHRLCQVYENE